MSLFLFACWLFFLWSIGWLMLPLSRRIWRDFLPDGGLAVGRALFLGVATLGAFWLGNLGVPVRTSAIFVWIFVGLLALFALRQRDSLRTFVHENKRALLAGELLFFAVFFFFLAMRGFWPDVLWPGNDSGEKPMDMALISSLARADILPPANPYAAGTRLTGYYSFGHLQTALVSNALGAAPRWTYNLMAATVPALCFSVLAGLCIALTRSLRGGLLAAILVLTCGTLQPLLQWWQTRHIWPLDYMGTSRVIPFTINEYPWFSFSYADLHAHLFGMPFALLALCCGWALLCRLRNCDLRARGWKLTTILAALALSFQILTNTWDFPAYAMMLALCLASATGSRMQSTPEFGRTFEPVRRAKIGAKKAAGKVVSPPLSPRARAAIIGAAILAMGLCALILAMPFLARLHSEASKPAFLHQPASPAAAWLLVWGVPCGAWLIHLFFAARERMRNSQNETELKLAASLIVASLLARIALQAAGKGDFFVLIFLVAMTLWTAREVWIERDSRCAFLARLALCGLLALLWSETTWAGFLGDRKNLGFDDYKRQDTVFKFGLQAWFLLGSAAACATLRRVENSVIWARRWPLALRVASVALVVVMLFGSAATTLARARNFEQWHGLDAFANLAPEQRGAAQWLWDHARDGDNLIEAEMLKGGDYTEYSRYASATGVPAVVGPLAHSFQWGSGWDDVGRRKDDVRAFYSGIAPTLRRLSDGERLAILRLYRVRWVVCGDLERQQYGAAAIAQVERLLPDVVFESGTGAARVAIRRAI